MNDTVNFSDWAKYIKDKPKSVEDKPKSTENKPVLKKTSKPAPYKDDIHGDNLINSVGIAGYVGVKLYNWIKNKSEGQKAS